MFELHRQMPIKIQHQHEHTTAGHPDRYSLCTHCISEHPRLATFSICRLTEPRISDLRFKQSSQSGQTSLTLIQSSDRSHIVCIIYKGMPAFGLPLSTYTIIKSFSLVSILRELTQPETLSWNLSSDSTNWKALPIGHHCEYPHLNSAEAILCNAYRILVLRSMLLNMQLNSLVFTSIFLLAGLTESFFFIPLGGGGPPAPPPAPQCQGNVQLKPLGSFLLGPNFPNPWSGLGGNFNIPNCNTPPPIPPAPPCPAGQSCQTPPRQPTFPSQQATADAQCNGAGGGSGLRACLDYQANPIYCCAA